MTRSPRIEPIPERNGGKGDEGEEDRKERGQSVEDPVCSGRDDVFLGEHLDGVGKGMEQPHQPEPEDAGAVGPDSVLDDRRLLALDPGVQPGKVQHPKKHEQGQDQLDCQIRHGAGAPATAVGRASPTPWDPIFS